MSYSTPKAIPQSWAMTTLDPARIEARKETLMLQSSPGKTNDIIERPIAPGLLKEQELPHVTISEKSRSLVLDSIPGSEAGLVRIPAPKKRFVLLHPDLTCQEHGLIRKRERLATIPMEGEASRGVFGVGCVGERCVSPFILEMIG
jgi:hypothetical protein